ncbi:trifolitoxin immunity protein [Nocardia nova]|uniref:Trifolitoxin immunity protein n=1 Tax=Nocardia nova TaxID=37330 RepID=A0A2S6AKT0_9NOCA|nr:phosphotransferase [Nocardia nova]PPJ35826.1 trifolitoxin immunity protein [Nocardia nova]
MTEIPLSGGFTTHVVRVADTVHRTPGPRAEFVHQLLDHFDNHDWSGAPRFLGTDPQSREILTYLPGHTLATTDPSVRTPENLIRVARLVRRFHDLTAGTPLAGAQEVVCHNDLSPRNTIYISRVPAAEPVAVAFIDWDLAAPGARIHDIAHMCWQYLNLGPGVNDVAAAAADLKLLCDEYGTTDLDAVIDTVLWWQQRSWRGIESGADAGDPAMIRLRNTGTVDAIRSAYSWVRGHRHQLTPRS